MSSYLAITAHYMGINAGTGRLELRTELLAFRHFSGGHDGKSISEEVLKILRAFDIHGKV